MSIWVGLSASKFYLKWVASLKIIIKILFGTLIFAENNFKLNFKYNSKYNFFDERSVGEPTIKNGSRPNATTERLPEREELHVKPPDGLPE